MTIEELKLVLEMVGTVSGDAKTIAIIWMLLDIGKLLVVFGSLLGMAFIGLKAVKSTQNERRTLQRINRELGLPGGAMPLFDHQFDDIVDAVIKLKKGGAA
jgi:hypothetical protein